MSLGASSGSTTLRNAVDAAYNSGTLPIAAAGNDGNPGGNNDVVGYPARYDSVIAVAATDKNNNRARFSSTGPDVELAAPGVDILSTKLGGGTTSYDGTSMAAPHVSGLAALIYNSPIPAGYDDGDGVWEPAEVRKRLRDTARDLGTSGHDWQYGFGLIDAAAAVDKPTSTHDVAVTSIDAPAEVTQGETATITVTVENQGDYTEETTLTVTDQYDGGVLYDANVTLTSGETRAIDVAWNTTGETAGDHAVSASLSAVSGESDTGDNTASTTVTIRSAHHDIAVQDVSAPTSVVKGETVTVDVTVENTGTYDETVNLTLVDNQTTIGTKQVSLAAGATTVVSYTWNTSDAYTGDHVLTATAYTEVTEADTANNDASTVVTVTEPVYDLAVTGIDAPASVQQNDSATINVSIENQGSYEETTTLTLRDEAGTTIDARSITLAAGASKVETFTWDTTGYALGDHILTAKLDPLTDETDTADNERSAVVTVEDAVTVSPTIDQFDVTKISSPNPHIEYQVDWAVSDAQTDLDTVTTTLRDSGTGTVYDTVTTDVSGGTASGTTDLKHHKGEGSGASYEIVLKATDAAGNTVSATK